MADFIHFYAAVPAVRPKVSGRMVELQKLLVGTDVKLVTLTVDPDFDKPDVLKATPRRSEPTRIAGSTSRAISKRPIG